MDSICVGVGEGGGSIGKEKMSKSKISSPEHEIIFESYFLVLLVLQ